MRNKTEEIFKRIEYYDEYFPEEYIKDLLSSEEETKKFLIEYIKSFQKNIFKHLNEENYVGHIYAVIMLAQFREKSLCSLFLQLLRLPGTRVYELFDKVLPEYGARIIASVYDGDINNIVNLLNDKKVNEYVKAIIIQALKILCINEEVNKEKLENFFIELLNGKLKNKNRTLLLEMVYTAFELKMDKLIDVVKKSCASGEFKSMISADGLDEEIKEYIDGKHDSANIEDDHNKLIVDAFAELKKIFDMIDEQSNLKRQTQELQNTIINEINQLSKKFEKGICSLDFEEQLKSLNKDELYDIGKKLGLKGYYKLRKDDLRKLIFDNFEERVKEKLYFFDDERIRELILFTKCGGKRKIEKGKQFNTFFYLESYGLIFPFSEEEKTAFVMPELVSKIIKEVTSSFLFRKKIKINNEIVVLIRGMLEAYGIISINELVRRLRMYDITEDEISINKVINEGSGIYYSILDNKYILNGNIDNFSIIEELKKTKFVYEYKFFPKSEIISMGKGEWIENVDYAEEFYEKFSEEFIIEKENIKDIINDMKSDIQVVEPEVITNFMIESIDNSYKNEEELEELKESKKIVKKLVEEFLENVPIWKYKGRNMKEIHNK